MAFSLLRGDEATSSKEPLDTLSRRRAVLAALGCLLLVAIGALLNAHAFSSDTAYFAGLIDDLAKWWEGLSWYEKAAVLLTVLLTAALLTVATGGGWIAAGFSGLSAALTLQEVLSNPRPVTSFLRNPIGFIRSWWRELRKRPPQEAAVAVTALLAEQVIERIPAVKVLNRLADGLKDTAQRIAKKLWGRDNIEATAGRRMDTFSTDDSIRNSSGEMSKGTSSGSGNSADRSSNSNSNYDDKDPFEKQNKVTDNYLPNFEQAFIDSRKLTQYALNHNHPVGKHKAKVFESVLGYNQSNAGDLIRQIKQKLPECTAIKGKLDQYGQRYTVDIPVVGPNGRSAIVRTGWIIKTGSNTPSLTTIYVK